MLRRLAGEFDLGEPRTVVPLTGGGAEVVRVETARGRFVVKPVWPTYDGELYARVARTLNARGIRQARPVLNRSGAVVSTTGRLVLEWLPGTIVHRPSATQSDALFRYLSAYDDALSDIPVPESLATEDTIFTRVVSPTYLSARLPELFGQFAPAGHDETPVLAALSQLESAASDIAELPSQIVHGDVAPDNVLYDGDDVVAVIDFTPRRESVLFGVCTALYWYHVSGHREGPSGARLRSGLAAYAERRPWSALELRLWPVLLVREALRRLATPLAAAEESGRPLREHAIRNRYAAVRALADGL